jgi:hypothetical protein
MLSYEDIILLGEERVLVIQEHEEGRCWRSDLAMTTDIPVGHAERGCLALRKHTYDFSLA